MAASAVSGVPLMEGALTEGRWPEWFDASRRRGWEDFQKIPAPAAKDEHWRFSNVKALALDAFRYPAGVSDSAALVARSNGLGESAARFVFGNNRLLAATAPAADLVKAGLVVMTLEEAAEKHAGLVQKHFMAQEAKLGSAKYAALHRSGPVNGVFIRVPGDLEVAQPIEIFHWVEGENSAVFPHTLVVCERHSKATVVDCFRSADNAPAFACGVNDLVVGEGAKLDYVAVQQWSSATTAFHLNSTTVGRDASCLGMQVNVGGKFVRNENYSRMVAEGARSDMLSVNISAGDQMIDQRTFQDHVKPQATSDLLYQNALTGKGRTIFSGVIRVEPGAHKTDAYQKVRNIVLSDDAEANSMPGLEIEADDVRCTHGATTAQVDDRELFYLLARGIRPEAARQLLVMGFFNTVLERLPDKKLRGHIEGLVEARLTAALRS
ncbi:MAG: Fe-S cluster assembly protein SufD [Chthoniobacterales bacterium]|nr:Fe-S cluster assembly protein SufD [Chthoniobacterales bacterium]